MLARKERDKRIPPDGGWGYAIGFAAFLMLLPVTGFRPSFGMMYHDILQDIGTDTTIIGFITGFTVMICSLSAFMTSPMLTVLSIRQAALLAAILLNLGSVALVFSNSTFTFFLTQTIIQSSGVGLVTNMAYISIREYFMKKRLLIVSIVQTSTAVAAMCVPMIIKYATDYYGYRGMLLVIAGIYLHQFVGVCLLQPVAWHMKEELPVEAVVEMETFLPDTKETHQSVTPKINNDIGDVTVKDKKENDDKIITELDETSKFRNFIRNIIDVDLMKKFVFSAPNVTISIANFTSFMYIVMLPSSLYAEVKRQNEVAWALSLVGFGDLGMKIIFIFFNTLLKKIESRKLHLTGATIAFAARLGFHLTTNSIAKLIFLPFIGAGTCFLTVTRPLVVADYVPSTKYSGAMGINSLSIGTLNLVLAPALGAIKDLAGSFDVIFGICIAFYFFIMLLWMIEIKVKKKEVL